MTINGTNESDSEVLWTWERMLERTKPYCESQNYYSGKQQKYVKIWCVCRLALDDILHYTCLQ